jgi:hypothetical protein
MKMIAKIVPTSTGFDIINKAKDKKYIQVIVKNNIPIKIKSYISSWYLDIYGAGKFHIKKISKENVAQKVSTIISKKLDDNIKFIEVSKITNNKKYFKISYRVKFAYPNDANIQNTKRYCKKNLRKISKKVSSVEDYDSYCTATLKIKILNKNIMKLVKEDIVNSYPQLKFTKKFKISKNGTIMYKIIDKVN